MTVNLLLEHRCNGSKKHRFVQGKTCYTSVIYIIVHLILLKPCPAGPPLHSREKGNVHSNVRWQEYKYILDYNINLIGITSVF